MYELLEKLEALIKKWENMPYTGDYSKGARSVCAKELRAVIGKINEPQRRWIQDKTSNCAALQRGCFEDDILF